MKPELQLKACAELDGWTCLGEDAERVTWWIQFSREVISKLSYDEIMKQRRWEHPNYFTYNAIIPLIQKQTVAIRTKIAVYHSTAQNQTARTYDYMMLTPQQLVEALLRATGKWIES